MSREKKQKVEKKEADQGETKEGKIVCPTQGVINALENEDFDNGIPGAAKKTAGACRAKAGTMVDVNTDDAVNFDHDTCKMLIFWGYGEVAVRSFYIENSSLRAGGSRSNAKPTVTESAPVEFEQGGIDHGIY